MTTTGDDGIVRETVYGYDAPGRLIEETERVAGSVVEQSRYAYDRVGNRTSVEEAGVVSSASFDANDRMLAASDTTFAYDANGNLISQASPTGTQTYQYDARQRLVEATTAAGQQFEFIYDADGNRVGRTARATPAATPINTRFLVDKAMALPEVIAEVDASHAITSRYLHGHDLAQQQTRQDGGLRLRYPLRDGQGSTIALADGAGTVTDRYRYTPWGVERMASGDTANAHRYAGEMWEREVGLSYNRARWYVPGQGRFTQMDVFAGFANDPRSLHKYGYVHADPVNGTDPSGYMTIAEFATAGLVAATFGAAAVAVIDTWKHRPGAAGNAGPGLWEIVVAMAVMSQTPSLVNSLISSSSDTDPERNEDHHTIPIYLCGAVTQQTSSISRTLHKKIHADLAFLPITIKQASDYADSIVPLGRTRRANMLRFLETEHGRRTVAGALDYYYDTSGVGTQGRPPIINVFKLERDDYIAGHTSIDDFCHRDGDVPRWWN